MITVTGGGVDLYLPGEATVFTIGEAYLGSGHTTTFQCNPGKKWKWIKTEGSPIVEASYMEL